MTNLVLHFIFRPYRAMLGHVANLAKERDVLISEILDSQSQNSNTENSNDSNGDMEKGKEMNDNENNTGCQCGSGTSSRKSSLEGDSGSKEARDEAIQVTAILNCHITSA